MHLSEAVALPPVWLGDGRRQWSCSARGFGCSRSSRRSGAPTAPPAVCPPVCVTQVKPVENQTDCISHSPPMGPSCPAAPFGRRPRARPPISSHPKRSNRAPGLTPTEARSTRLVERRTPATLPSTSQRHFGTLKPLVEAKTVCTKRNPQI